jgi:hypothetical protein
MKPHPRIRMTIKWGSAAAIPLLMLVWIGSAWRGTYWISPGGFVAGIDGGLVSVQQCSPLAWTTMGGKAALANALGAPRDSEMVLWYHSTETDTLLRWSVAFPAWELLLPPLLILCLARHLDSIALRRAARLNRCPKCNYDRAGIAADAVCPECGAKAL